MFLLAVAGLLPLAVMAGVALLALARFQREQAVRSAIETTRALGTAIDSELAASVATLEALASQAPSSPRDLWRYHAQLRQVIATQPRWRAITLADPAGTLVAHTDFDIGTELPAILDEASFQEVVRARRSVVGRLVSDPQAGFRIPIRAPVVRGGVLLYVVTAHLKPDSLLAVVERQQVPADWLVSVFDSQGLRVARSRQHQRYLGTPAAPSLAELMRGGADEGFGETFALEGERIYTAFSRSRTTRWTIAVGFAPSVIEAGALRSRVAFFGGVGFSLAAALVAALAITRSIAGPITELSAGARGLVRGDGTPAPRSTIREIQEVSDVLAEAGVEQRRHEAERDELLRREQAARAIAEEANRAKDDFLAMLGHELRNPLGAIRNAHVILQNPRADDGARARATAVIGRQVDHLARMTDDILDATRAMTGKIVLQREPLDAAAAISEVVTELRGGIAQQLREDLEPVWIDADPTRVEQIVTNLVGNAIKYTPPDGHVSISLRREGDEAVLRVADDGIGMSADLVLRVFDPFVQGGRGLDRSHGGLGLGLTLVRQLVTLHGGTVSASSDGPDRGSEFVVRWPAIAPRAAEPASAPRVDSVRARDILIVDDNDDARESLQAMFEIEGHRVRTARDATSALATMQSAPPEIAIIDIGLPTVDGYELARRIIRTLEGSRRPRLVALTGYGLPGDRERSREAGFDHHLVKPVELDELRAVLTLSAATG